MKTVYVAVGVIIYNQKILIAQRQAHQHQGNLWEFPGGKIETNENMEQALIRELKEEVNLELEISQLNKLMLIPHVYEDKKVFLNVAWTEINTEQYESIIGKENQPLNWVTVEEINHYPFPLANRPIILRLPILLDNPKLRRAKNTD